MKNMVKVSKMLAVITIIVVIAFAAVSCSQKTPPADNGKAPVEGGKAPADQGKTDKTEAAGDSANATESIKGMKDEPMGKPKDGLNSMEIKRAKAKFDACRSNMKNYGTALEMYATEHGGKYPESLKELIPDILGRELTCPAAGADTYTESYVRGENGDSYYFYCKGHSHADFGVPENYPRYSSEKGMILPLGFKEKLSPDRANSSCESNLKNLGTAIEMYSTDHQGHYPEKLSEVAPAYIREIPKCPAAGKDTYSATFKSGQNPDSFEIKCSGHHHKDAGLPKDYPRYTSEKGLIEKP